MDTKETLHHVDSIVQRANDFLDGLERSVALADQLRAIVEVRDIIAALHYRLQDVASKTTTPSGR